MRFAGRSGAFLVCQLEDITHQLLDGRRSFRIEALQFLIEFDGDGAHTLPVYSAIKNLQRVYFGFKCGSKIMSQMLS